MVKLEKPASHMKSTPFTPEGSLWEDIGISDQFFATATHCPIIIVVIVIIKWYLVVFSLFRS